MPKITIVLLSLLFMFVSSYGFVQSEDSEYKIPTIKVPSWNSNADFKKEEKKIIKKIKYLESHSYNEDWEQDFAYVYQWVSKVPYLKIKLDLDYLPTMAESVRRKNRGSILFAYMFWYGNVLYVLQHPKAKPNQNRVIKRGFKAMVNFYNALREKNHTFRYTLMEQYEELLDDDDMDDYINAIKKRYKKKKKRK